jgi:hypothetical protein
MRKRPFSLFLCALLFCYFPIEFSTRLAHADKFRGFDAIVSVVLPCLLVFGLIKVTRVGWYTLVAMVSLWGVKDLYQYYSSHTPNLSPLLVHLAIYVISLAYFINPRVRTLYFDPKLRWWRAKPRFETHLPSLLHTPQDWQYPVLLNISEGGCFIETNHLLDANTHLDVAIPLPVPLNLSVIKVEGEVRWVSTNPLRHGMGIQFNNPSPQTAKALRSFVANQL